MGAAQFRLEAVCASGPCSAHDVCVAEPKAATMDGGRALSDVVEVLREELPGLPGEEMPELQQNAVAPAPMPPSGEDASGAEGASTGKDGSVEDAQTDVDGTCTEGSSPPCGKVLTLNAPNKHRRSSRSSKKSGYERSSTVLSNVAESNQDVHFRIELFVGGKLARDVVKAVCSCEGVTVAETEDVVAHPPDRKHGSRKKGKLVSCHFTINEELAKITFRTADTFDQVPTVAGSLQANTSLAVKLINIDAATGTCDRNQFMDVAGWLGEEKKYRQKYAFIFIQTDQAAFQEGDELNESGIIDSQRSSGPMGATWDEHLCWFEREFGSVWNFGPIPDHDPYEFHSVFQEIVDKLVSEDSDDEACKAKASGVGSLLQASDASTKASTSSVSALLSMGKTLSEKITRKGKKAKTAGNFPFDDFKDPASSASDGPPMEARKSTGLAVVNAISAKFKRSSQRAKTDITGRGSEGPVGNFPFGEWRDPAVSSGRE